MFYRVNLPDETINSVILDEKTGDVYLGTPSGLAILRSNPLASTFQNYDATRVGPNPLRLSSGEPLRFRGIIPGSNVKILTANGQLVADLNREGIDEVQWNGLNLDGKKVNTGVYVYLITGGDGQSLSGKILIVND